MKRTLPLAAIAASLLFGSLSAAAADDALCDDFPFDGALATEQRLLGDGAEAARLAELQPFTRELWAQDIIGDRSFAVALTAAGVPATVVLEMRQALAGTIDLDRELGAGDRFYARYRQPFTADGGRIGVARLVWAELRTRTKGTLALHRFRSQGGEDRLWLANGEAVGAPPIRLPLDIINVSSGFGLRPDPLDKPGPAMGPLADPAPVVAAPPPEPPPPPKQDPLPPPRRPSIGGMSAFGGARDVFDSGRLEFNRPRPEPPPEAAAPPPPEPVKVEAPPPPPPPPKPKLFMHDGLDLVAVTGTSIYAAADGIVTGAGPNGRYGNWMQIEHAGKITTVYGHLSEFAPGVGAGTRVSQGELIGFVGNTGRSTGAHLHFELLVAGRTVNPLAYPLIKRAQLASAELERFRRQVKRALAERDREVAVDADLADLRN